MRRRSAEKLRDGAPTFRSSPDCGRLKLALMSAPRGSADVAASLCHSGMLPSPGISAGCPGSVASAAFSVAMHMAGVFSPDRKVLETNPARIETAAKEIATNTGTQGDAHALLGQRQRTSVMSASTLLGVPFLRPPRRSPGADPTPAIANLCYFGARRCSALMSAVVLFA